jgi:hypothetical protein
VYGFGYVQIELVHVSREDADSRYSHRTLILLNRSLHVLHIFPRLKDSSSLLTFLLMIMRGGNYTKGQCRLKLVPYKRKPPLCYIPYGFPSTWQLGTCGELQKLPPMTQALRARPQPLMRIPRLPQNAPRSTLSFQLLA